MMCAFPLTRVNARRVLMVCVSSCGEYASARYAFVCVAMFTIF